MSNIAYRPDIDGLRAVAVGAVVVFHAFPNLLPGGFIGVDVFFVISGYLITGIIQTGLQRGDFSFIRFYARRARRIFPALALVLATCLVAGWFLLLPGELERLGRHVAAGAVFVSNIALWQESGYFEEASSRTILLHLWSLGIEEQFYLVWPMLLVLAWKLRIPALWAVGAVLAVSVAPNLWLIGYDPVQTFYSPFTRAWELAIGAMLSLWPRRSQIVPLTGHILSFTGLSLIVIASVWFTEAAPFPGWRAVLPTIGAAAIIAASPSAGVNSFLKWRLPVAIGKISYPLYLWHWPLLVFPALILDGNVSAAWRSVAVVVATLLAFGTYKFVERPIRGDRTLLSKAGFATASLGLVAILGITAYASQGLPARPGIGMYATAQAMLDEKMAWPYAENDNCLNRFPSTDRREGWWFCVLEEDAPPTLFLMGNSFANHLYPGVAAAFPDDNILQFGSCDPGMGLSFSYPPAHPCYGEARQGQEATVSRIIDDNPTIRRVILSAPWPSFNVEGQTVDYFDPTKIDGEYRSVPPIAGETSYDAFMNALERRIAFLEDRNIDTTLVLMTPELGYDPRTCYSGRPLRPATNTCQVSYAAEMKKQARFREGLRLIIGQHPTLKVFDPLPVFCREGICDLKGDAGPLLRDVGHLSVEGSIKLANALARSQASAELAQMRSDPSNTN